MVTYKGVEKIILNTPNYIMTTAEIEEERIKARKAAKLRYAKQPWTCNTCKVTVNMSHKWDHERTKRHVDNVDEMFRLLLEVKI